MTETSDPLSLPHEDWQARQNALIGSAASEKLASKTVLVFGVGGVGGALWEALARAGVGHLAAIDGDTFAASNLNRQILSQQPLIGKPKALAARERAEAIAPGCRAEGIVRFVTPEAADGILEAYHPDFVCDAIDCVSTKIALAEACRKQQIPLVSCMGTGKKLDMTRLKLADLSKTSVCPLARVMRSELRKRGITHLTVVYSDEEPKPSLTDPGENEARVPSSISYVPPAAGLLMAQFVILSLITEEAYTPCGKSLCRIPN